MKARILLALGGTAAVAAGLVGCSAQHSFWDEEQTEADVLPGFVDNEVLAAESRFLAEDGEMAYYVSRDPAEETTCLVMAQADTEYWMAGCSTNLPITISGVESAMLTGPSPEPPAEEGYTKLADFLYVR